MSQLRRTGEFNSEDGQVALRAEKNRATRTLFGGTPAQDGTRYNALHARRKRILTEARCDRSFRSDKVHSLAAAP